MNEMQRRLPLEGAINTRDIGGYDTQKGRQTKWQVFLRSDALDILTEADQQTLLEYGVRQIVDLRTFPEADNTANVFASSDNIIYKHLPMFESGPELEYVLELPSHFEAYLYFLEHCQPAIKAILEAVANLGDGCTLYHCSRGTDRTGVITALLLGLVQVDDEIIVQDYALSTQYFAPRMAKMRQQVLDDGGDLELFDRWSAAKPDMLRQMLTYLKDQYGGIPNYVQAIGVDAATVDFMRLRFLDDVS